MHNFMVAVGFATVIVVAVLSFIRYRIVMLQRRYLDEVNVHALVKTGQLVPPRLGSVFGLALLSVLSLAGSFGLVHGLVIDTHA